ncbi:MAG: PH domain-containing protein [bacterium]
MKPAGAATDLREPRHRVSRRAVPYWTVKALGRWIVGGAIGALLLMVFVPDTGWRIGVASVVAVIAVIHLVVMPRWRFAVHRWELTDIAVYTQSGWFAQERRIAPISRVQTVDRERGPLEQLFGLANVTVTTASAAGPVRIEALDLATAAELVERVTSTAEISEGDAT